MVRVEDDCVHCGLPCLGNDCELTHVKHYYCDCCGDDVGGEDLYLYDGEELCWECLEKKTRIKREY